MTKNRKSQSGFTLVELSIVLVIIGLIIGGVLTGRQIMQNAEVTNALNSIQAYQAQFQTYVQNYGALPGDDASAVTRFGNNVSNHGDGSGTLDGSFDSVVVGAETILAWQDLRAAGLVKPQASNIQPTNPFGGIFGFQHGAFSIASNVLCLNNVSGDAAQAIDSRLDDGVSGTGTIQSIQETPVAGTPTTATPGATPTASYVSGQTYTMCIGM